jgi:hypothetical protein
MENDGEEEEKEQGRIEDVRMSNFAFAQTKIAEYLCFFYASIGVGSAVVASEMTNLYNDNDSKKTWI